MSFNKYKPVMKIITFFSALITFVSLFSCSNNSSDETSKNPVDFKELADSYKSSITGQQSDETIVFDNEYSRCLSFVNTDSGNLQKLCCLGDWKLKLPNEYKSNAQCPDMELLYNALAFEHSINSDYEIWARTQTTGDDEGLVQTDSIVDAINGMDCSFPHKKLNVCSVQFRDAIVEIIRHPEQVDEACNPNLALSEFENYVYSNYVVNLLDSNALCSYDETIDSMLAKYDKIVNKVSQTEEDKRFSIILDYLKSAKTFDEQCGIALACCMKQNTYCGVWSLHMLACLMESGKYSVLLEKMWNVWRLLTQMEFFGMSRDSVIPNHLYDIYRKKVYTTSAKYISKNGEDNMAFVMSVFLASRNGIIRNGSFIMGNDTMIELYSVCPGFFDSME